MVAAAVDLLRLRVLAAANATSVEEQSAMLAALAADLDALDTTGRRAWIQACVAGRPQVGRARIILNALQVADADVAASLLRSIAAGIIEDGGVLR